MDNSTLTGLLHGLPGVDQVGLEGRAATLATRSIKKDSKIWAIDTAISMVDLTTLEGMDTDGKVRALCTKALHPDPTDPTCPAVAAVCVYGDLVATTRACVGDRVHVAAVATAFPSGRASMDVKLMDTKQAVADGADEIDMVIDRGAFLAGADPGAGFAQDQVLLQGRDRIRRARRAGTPAAEDRRGTAQVAVVPV